MARTDQDTDLAHQISGLSIVDEGLMHQLTTAVTAAAMAINACNQASPSVRIKPDRSPGDRG